MEIEEAFKKVMLQQKGVQILLGKSNGRVEECSAGTGKYTAGGRRNRRIDEQVKKEYRISIKKFRMLKEWIDELCLLKEHQWESNW